MGLIRAAIIKFFVSNLNLGVIEDHKFLNGFSDVEKCLDGKEYFNMLVSKDLLSKQTLGWKKFFEMGVKIPNKECNCGDCKEYLI